MKSPAKVDLDAVSQILKKHNFEPPGLAFTKNQVRRLVHKSVRATLEIQNIPEVLTDQYVKLFLTGLG